MNVLIFEDEKPTAIRLTNLLTEIDKSIKVIDIIASVEAGIKWFANNDMPDLIFQDIMLSDGNCFDIFSAVEVKSPVIFTTAFSDYALRSFQVNSIDYIVKPYDIKDIEAALQKFRNIKDAFRLPENKLLNDILNRKEVAPKKRFLVKIGDNYLTINSSDVAYLISKEGVSFATLFNGQKHIVDYSIIELSGQMEPSVFFQVNRKMIINISSVKKISSWFNSRLTVELIPPTEDEIIVSRERVSAFKQWLDK